MTLCNSLREREAEAARLEVREHGADRWVQVGAHRGVDGVASLQAASLRRAQGAPERA